MTTASDFNALITALENNLQTMGVLDASFDSTTGVLGLVVRILDIEASVGGIILSTSLSCTAASNSIYEGQSIILSGKLSASYNDTSQTDDDLEGYLKSATIEIYNGQTLLGTCTTDSNGEYLFTHQCNTAGTLNLTAKYEGTDFYDPSTSTSVTVSVNELTIEGISLSSDKSILSAADNEYATLTATLLDGNDDPLPISGETITFEVRKQSDDSLVETLTADTDSSGIATVSYLGKGAGDLYIQANCGIIFSETYIRDIFYYDSQTTDKSKIILSKGTGTLSYSENGVTVHGTKYNDESLWTVNGLTLPNEYEIEITVSNLQGQGTGILLGDEILVDLVANISGITMYRLQSGSYSNIFTQVVSFSSSSNLKIRVELGVLKVYINDNLITQVNYAPTNSFKYRSYGNDRYTTFKDLTIQEL